VDDGPRRIRITERAERDLKQLPTRDQVRVRAALDGLTRRPPTGDIRKLQGIEGEWRLRVGDWRVRFRLSRDQRWVDVLRILPRGRAYRD
jgi:mRNA interferase RelE/StbE